MKEQDKDHLKEFVYQHRDEFDTEAPPKMDFSHLSEETKESAGPRMIPITWLYRVAAVLVVAFSVSLYWLLDSQNTDQSGEIAEEQVQPEVKEFSLSELSPEMAELEEYYTNELSAKQQVLEEMGYGDAISEELEILDMEFTTLKSELGENVDNHLIVNEMIKNYKLKLDLLESVLNDLQDNYDDKNLTNLEDDEKYTIYY